MEVSTRAREIRLRRGYQTEKQTAPMMMRMVSEINAQLTKAITNAPAKGFHAVLELAAAIGLGQLAQSLLFELQGHDPLVLSLAAGPLVVVALGAGLIQPRGITDRSDAGVPA